MDPNLIPPRPENGCPAGSYDYNGMCCCADRCCWDNCRLEEAPEECLSGVKGSRWLRDAQKNNWVAQIAAGNMNLLTKYNVLYNI